MKRMGTILLLIFSAVSAAASLAWAGPTAFLINYGEYVRKTIPVDSGFSTTIHFPEPVEKAVLADSAAFACELFVSKIICTAKGNYGQKTNMTVFTPKNDYDLTLTAANNSASRYIEFQYDSTNKPDGIPAERDPIAEAILAGFSETKIKKRKESQTLSFRLEKAIRLGRRFYILFSMENKGTRPITIAGLDLFITTTGGLTGLPIKKTKIHGTAYHSERTKIMPKGTGHGVVMSRPIKLSNLEELSVVLQTDEPGINEISIDNIRF